VFIECLNQTTADDFSMEIFSV